MKYGLYSDSNGRYSICDYAADRGWAAVDGLKDAIFRLEQGDGWVLHFESDRDLAIHLVDFDTLTQLYSDHPELFI